MTTSEKYVAAVYLLVFAVVLVYVAIMAAKLGRLEREVEELTRLARERKTPAPKSERRKEVGVG